MFYKSITVAALLLVGDVAVSYIRDGYEKGSVVPPKHELSDVSLQLGDWRGKELPSDSRLREILCAQAGIDRVYQNGEGQEVLVHAVWTDDYLRLHFPQQCYRESGWELTGSKDIEIGGETRDRFTAKILSFVQDGRKIQVLYWFQLGEHVFLDRVQHRLLRRKVCWGQKEWPPLMKFMLETSDLGLGRGDEALLQVASELNRQIAVNLKPGKT